MILALQIVLFIFLASVSIALATVEAAFYMVKRRRLGHLALPNSRAEIVNRYLDDPPALLMPVHLGTYTAHVGMTVMITTLLLDYIGPWAALIAFTTMVVYLLVFRLTVPYALVRRNPERSLLTLAPFYNVYAQALAPMVRMLRTRVGAEHAAPSDNKTASGPQPVLEVPPPPVQDVDEARLVDSMNRFAETLVSGVMTPRPDIVALPATARIAEVMKVMRETKYSRIPVFGENLDDIVGVVGVRDLVEFDGSPDDPASVLCRPVFLVPETKKVADLLKDLQSQRTTFAVVIDEYGGTAGLVSVEDIVEELVGEIKDEFDAESEPIAIEADGSVSFAGRVSVDRLEQALDLKLREASEVGTVGGLVTSIFGRIPKAGERTDYDGFMIEVVEAEKTRVTRVRFIRKPPEEI